jgi:hypothetical protein
MTEVVKLEIFVPKPQVHFLRDELAKIGVGKIGTYDHCSSVSTVSGSWRPLLGSDPYQGEIGTIEHGEECRLEMNCARGLVPAALEVVRRIHPYETPVVNIVPLLNNLFE